ncbi:MAG TPA: ATP-binding protein [Caulobacteraceae bacterium]|nr:ATP-binding protein [Caulobacteraceae bacterium]
MAIVTTVAVLVAACVSFMLEQWLVARQDARLANGALADVVATAAAPALVRNDPADAAKALIAAARSKDLVEARLTDAQGRPFARYAAPATHKDRPTAVILRPVQAGGRTIGQLSLRSTEPSLSALLPRFLALTAALFFGASGIALFVAQGLARRVAAPIERLSNAMAEVAVSGEFKPVAEEMEDDVFHRLTESFNNLLAQLDANHRELHQTMADLVEARDAADAANVAKSQFLANMSHEIRTPLNGVLAMAEVMARGDLAPPQRERLAVVRQSGEQLLAVLNDVLDLSKIEAGKLDLEIHDFDIERVAQQVRDSFSVVAAGKGLAFAVEVAPEAAGMWRGDGDRLRQIVNNLVSNALKFTPSGSVTARFELADAGGVRLSVTDTGIGIPRDKMVSLFDKFTQADSSTTRRYGGTGLGLAICRELAQLMHGSISVTSEEGKGSTFYAELPLERGGAEAPQATPAVAPEMEQRSVRVLAAEDNPVNQKVLQAIVEPMDVDLVIVGDGRAAVEAWKREPWDIILMDIQMPIMDGIAAARAIRSAEASEQRPRTPILALTANAMVHQIEEYLASGMDGHVAKPIEIAKLYDALNRALAGHSEAVAA